MADDALSPVSSARFSVRERWLGLLLFVLALGLRLWVQADYEAHHPQAGTPVIDEASYHEWAKRIAAGDWLGQGVFFQEPLYSYVLGALYWITGPSLHAARVAQALVGAATVLVILLATRRAFGRGAGWLAGVLWAVYRPALWFPVLLLKENLFCLVFAGLAWAILRARERGGKPAAAAWGFVGVLAGLGALLRGNLVPMLPAIALFPLLGAWTERRLCRGALLQAACIGAGAFLVLAPVALRNRAVGGEFALTTSGVGTNLYGGNNLDNPLGVAAQFDWVRTVPEHEADDWRHEAERRTGRALSAVEVSEYWLGRTLESVRLHPWEHAKILGRKLLLTLGPHEVPDNHFLEWDARHVAPLRLPWPGFPWLLAGALPAVALLATGRGRAALGASSGPALALFLLFVLYLGTVVLTVTSDRIRWPLSVLLAPFAAWSLLAAVHWVLGLRRLVLTTALSVAAGLGAALVLTFVPVLEGDAWAEERAEDFDERDYNLAVEMVRAKQSLAAAERIAAELATRHPQDLSVELLRAEIEANRALALFQMAGQSQFEGAALRAGRELDSALARLERVGLRGTAVQRHRADAMAGSLLQTQGRFAEAVVRLDRALEFDPEDSELLRRRAVCRANAAMGLPAGERRSEELQAAARALEALPGSAADEELVRLIGLIRAAR